MWLRDHIVLRLHNLEAFGLAPVELELEDGACLCITGPSGSGKSILLRAIADLDLNEGDAATETVLRSQATAPEWRRAVAYVPAESGWWGDVVGPHMPDGDVTTLLVDIGLDPSCLAWEVARLSTGEKQRLALVRALLTDPEVLLLDEPTSALDDEATELVERVIKHRLSSGTTVVLVTHDPAQIVRLNAQHAVVDQGRVERMSDAGLS